MALGPTQRRIQRAPGNFSLRLKRPGREADHSSLSSDKTENAWTYTSTPQYVFMAWCLAKYRDVTLPADTANVSDLRSA
jgi:hypothetical protein